MKKHVIEVWRKSKRVGYVGMSFHGLIVENVDQALCWSKSKAEHNAKVWIQNNSYYFRVNGYELRPAMIETDIEVGAS